MLNNNSYSLGQNIEGFEIKSIDNIVRIKQKVYQLEHSLTGANLVHLENEDKNNAFGIGFLTCPQNSSGVAHILEHLVLCGSKKFPVKDPFFSMLKRSLATFMNAFTASDWTMYPFATKNKKDFYNLLNVYTDAVFFPLLKESSFVQEAHHLEKKQDRWQAGGVVFNEMKGAMSSPLEIVYRRTQQAVFPTITYHHNSGGEPLDILDLTLEDLKNFHQTHYHPSNAKIFSYGSFPLRERLAFLNEKILKNFSKIKKKEFIGKEKRFSKPQHFEFFYPISEGESALYWLNINWLTCPIIDSKEILALSLLEEILLGSLAAPLKFRLIDSNLGKDLADTTGFHSDYSESFFSIGLKGIEKNNLKKVEDLILNSLTELAKNKIDKFFIDSAIHQKEIEIKEISSHRYPYSLNLLFRFIGSWMNGGDIIEALDFDKQLQEIKSLVKKGNYFEGLIEKYFINNKHRVQILFSPQRNYFVLQEKEIQEKIEKLAKKHSSKKTSFKETLGDNNCLPSLELSEIELDFPTLKAVKKDPITQFLGATNGLEYWNFYLENKEVDFLENKDLAIISGMITEIGSKNHSYEKLAAKINRYTGGINFIPLAISKYDNKNYFQLLKISAMSLLANKEKMCDLLQEIIKNYSFDNLTRIKQWIEQITLAKSNSILHQGHSYAESLSCRSFSPSALLDENQSGIHFLARLKEIQSLSKKNFQEWVKSCQNMWDCFLRKSKSCYLSISDDLEKTNELFSSFSFPIQKKWTLLSNYCPQKKIKEIWTIPTSVSFVARSYLTTGGSHSDNPLLLLLSKIIQANFIHTEIREKGGAYGGIVHFSVNSGIFCFVSYRDPHLLETWGVYKKAIDWILAGKFNEEQIKNAILQTFAAMDKPLSPAAEAKAEFMKRKIGITYKQEKEYRKKIIQATKNDLVKVADKWLTKNNYCDVAITSPEKITAAIKKEYAILAIP